MWTRFVLGPCGGWDPDGYGRRIAGSPQCVLATGARPLASATRPGTRPVLSPVMRTARAVQAAALLVALLAVAAADRVFGLGVACLGLGAAGPRASGGSSTRPEIARARRGPPGGPAGRRRVDVRRPTGTIMTLVGVAGWPGNRRGRVALQPVWLATRSAASW